MTKALSWAVIGVVAPALLALGAGFVLAGDSRTDFNIAHGCFLLAFFILWAKIIHLGFGSRRRKLLTYFLVFFGTGAMGVLGLAATQYVEQKRAAKVKANQTPPPPVTQEQPIYHAFKSIHERFKDKLGNPQPPTEPEMVYQARHEHSRIVWIDGKEDFYLLHDNNQLEIVRGVDVENDTYYFDEENRKRTGAPEGKYPPRGTFAMLWEREPETWKAKLGWRLWHCQYLKGSVHMQWFEHGLIIGDLRRVEEDYRAVVYVLLTDEHTWSREVPERPSPPCVKPATNAEEQKKWLEIHPRR